VIDAVEELLRLYPPPYHLRMNNGPEFIANVLQQWCIGSGCSAAYMQLRSACENLFAESLNSHLMDEFLNIGLYASVQEAKLLAVQHRIEYSTYRLHSALQGRTPLEVIQVKESGLTTYQGSEGLDQQRDAGRRNSRNAEE